MKWSKTSKKTGEIENNDLSLLQLSLKYLLATRNASYYCRRNIFSLFVTTVTWLKKCIIFQEKLLKVQFSPNYRRKGNIFDHTNSKKCMESYQIPYTYTLFFGFWMM